MAEKLKPCPCCGGKSELTKGYADENVWPHGEFHRVFCGVCQLRQLFHRTPESAIAAWNLRASAAMGQVPEGWAWMRHPTRNGGEPIPVKIVNSPDDGSKWFIPFDENACEFEWAERDEEWEILATPPATSADDAKRSEDMGAILYEDVIDAARYRALRDTAIRVQSYARGEPNWLFGVGEMRGATFDAAIDAAIATAPQDRGGREG